MFEFIKNGMIIYVLPAILICVTIHECAHGFVAFKLGDLTAAKNGRLTLNPIKHLDIVGFLLMVVAGFGYAKPVPVNMNNFKNRKWGMALVALAGPVSNLLMALVCFIVVVALSTARVMLYPLSTFFSVTALLNVGFAVFNMLPISPLDGSKVLFAFLPEKAYITVLKYERFGAIILLAFFAYSYFQPDGTLTNFLAIARDAVADVLRSVAALPFGGI